LLERRALVSILQRAALDPLGFGQSAPGPMRRYPLSRSKSAEAPSAGGILFCHRPFTVQSHDLRPKPLRDANIQQENCNLTPGPLPIECRRETLEFPERQIGALAARGELPSAHQGPKAEPKWAKHTRHPQSNRRPGRTQRAGSVRLAIPSAAQAEARAWWNSLWCCPACSFCSSC
jgi:hypothetical protein